MENYTDFSCQIVFCPNDDVVIQDMDMFNDYLVLFLNKNGLPMLCSIDMPIKAHTKVFLINLALYFFSVPWCSYIFTKVCFYFCSIWMILFLGIFLFHLIHAVLPRVQTTTSRALYTEWFFRLLW